MTDLHIHSTYSDGSLAPAQLLALAEETGLKIMSITDHNRIGAYEELKDPAVRSKFSGKIIPGCELGTTIRGQAVEILGYGFDPDRLRPFIEATYLNPKKPFGELHLIYSAYQERGVRLDLPESAYSKEEYISPKRFILSQLRAHEENRKFFLDPNNQNEVLHYYRRELYNPESPLFVDYSPLYPAAEAVTSAIRAAGGKAFLAHCYQYTSSITDHLPEIAEKIGLDGLECYYFAFTPEQTRYLIGLCRKNGLLISGGSDFHGALRPNVQLGCVAIDPKDLTWIEKNAVR